ncbi:MAG TPA: glycosyltransferase, partial [Planctomycetota bacterium]|nr:glycosyltransferase [Planctomycetota bacterium]
DGLDAVLVEPDDPAALARGIERLLADPALRQRLSARMLARAPDHTWDARARRLLAWMEARGAGRR